MSATPSLNKARRIAAMYDQLNFTGIEVLIINTTGSAWEDTFVFKVQTLIKCFKLPILARNSCLENEYLIRDKIPPSRVVRASLYNIRSQCAVNRWSTSWNEAQKAIRQKGYKKRKREDDGADLPPRKRQVRTLKYRKVRN